eukprot:6186237-Pleurochrysis_carterae.AAC.3
MSCKKLSASGRAPKEKATWLLQLSRNAVQTHQTRVNAIRRQHGKISVLHMIPTPSSQLARGGQQSTLFIR